MYDGVRRLSVLMIVLCGALLITYWVRHARDDYGLFHLLRGQAAPAPVPVADPGDSAEVPAYTPGMAPPVRPEEVSSLVQLSEQKARLAASVVPSVVSIETERSVQVARVVRNPLFGRDLVIPERGIEPGQGSGLILSEEGHIVTNHHVVEGAEAITVTLADGRPFTAMVLGADPVADIALLQLNVELEERFTPLPLGDSDLVRQGDMVFSVGSPFGLDGTFTDGVISSAVPRRVSDSTPPLLQTNTVLNRGNSGGPLVNVRGEVIGINRAIYNGADSGGNSGSAYGLAVPSNVVRAVAERIILDQGVPSYGYLGVYLKEVYPHEAMALGLESTAGSLVNGTLAGSPAYRAGIQANDVIVRFNGQNVSNVQGLVQLIQSTTIGTRVPIVIVRDRVEQELSVVIEGSGAVQIPEPAPALVQQAWEKTGLEVGYVTASDRMRMGQEPSQAMVEITKVRPLSVAKRIGLEPGLLIYSVDEVPTQTPSEFYEVLSERYGLEEITLKVSAPWRRRGVHLRMPLG